MGTRLFILLVGLIVSFPAVADKLESGDVIPVHGYCSMAGAAHLEETAKKDVRKALALVKFYMETGVCENSSTNGRPFIVKLHQVVSTFADAEKDYFEVWEVEVMGLPGLYYILNKLENVL